jgi:hypothetical protein
LAAYDTLVNGTQLGQYVLAAEHTDGQPAHRSLGGQEGTSKFVLFWVTDHCAGDMAGFAAAPVRQDGQNC